MEQLINPLPTLFIVGIIIIVGFYFGRDIRYLRLPSIIGFIILGALLGPSVLNLLDHSTQEELSFITEIALSFVALSIGLELRFSSIKNLGRGIVYIILFESFAAFLLVLIGIYLLTGNIALAILFGSVAPASAPAGTVAVIQEYRAKGSLTKALYAVVGFDDGLAIIIFGFSAAFARILLTGEASNNIWMKMFVPLVEIFFSIAIGIILAMVLSLFLKRAHYIGDIVILVFGFIFISSGICKIFHFSFILMNLVVGMVLVNTQPNSLIKRIHERLQIFLPLLFILFFTLAGSNLHLHTLPSLGLIGVTYIVMRSAGLVGGSRLGAMFGHVDEKIKKYIGLGILSQAGVAIGLSVIIKDEFQGLGKVVEVVNGQAIHSGDRMGTIIITTIMATCVFFEIIGPILTKIALQKAGEISLEK